MYVVPVGATFDETARDKIVEDKFSAKLDCRSAFSRETAGKIEKWPVQSTNYTCYFLLRNRSETFVASRRRRTISDGHEREKKNMHTYF